MNVRKLKLYIILSDREYNRCYDDDGDGPSAIPRGLMASLLAAGYCCPVEATTLDLLAITDGYRERVWNEGHKRGLADAAPERKAIEEVCDNTRGRLAALVDMLLRYLQTPTSQHFNAFRHEIIDLSKRGFVELPEWAKPLLKGSA